MNINARMKCICTEFNDAVGRVYFCLTLCYVLRFCLVLSSFVFVVMYLFLIFIFVFASY